MAAAWDTSFQLMKPREPCVCVCVCPHSPCPWRGWGVLGAAPPCPAQTLLRAMAGTRVTLCGTEGIWEPCVCVCVCVPPPPPLAGDAAIRDAQLTLGLRWLQQFREAQEQRGDVVAFDVFCGDLNFDNCSRGGDGAGRGGAGGFWWGVMAETCSPSPQGTSSTRGTGSSRCTRTPAAGSPGRTHPGP